MIDDALELAKDSMQKAVDRLQKDLGRIRTGRANPAMLDDLKVENYGSVVPVNQVATVSAADARLLVVKPWDRNMVAVIERAIINSPLGLNPSSDGVVVRVPIPALTQERREQLVKEAKDAAEQARISVRHARRDANETLKQGEKDKEISEDDLKRGLDSIQKQTDGYVSKIDEIVDAKERTIIDG